MYFKGFALLATGFVLVALVLPGMAQDRRKNLLDDGDEPTPKLGKTVLPTKKKLAGKVIEGRFNAKPQITVNGKAPLPFKAFTLEEVFPKGTAPDAKIKHANGAVVPAGKVIAALNKTEQWLAAKGYTLRGKGTVLLQRHTLDTAKLKAPALLQAQRLSPREEAIMKSPAVLQTEHAEAVKALATNLNLGPKIDVVADLFQPITTVRNYDESYGSSLFGASAKGNLTLRGDGKGVSLSAEGRAAVSIFGQSLNLLQATASVTAPRSGGLGAKLKVTTLGIDQVVLDETKPASWNKTGEFSKSLPDSFRVEHNFSIGPIPVSVEVGARASVKVPYYVGLLPGHAMAWIIPEVKSSAYAQAAVDVEVEIFGIEAGAEAGVELNLTLLDDRLTIFGSVKQGQDAKGKFIEDNFISRNDLHALKGRVLVYVELRAGSLSKRFDDEVFSFGGINHISTPFAGGQKRYLQTLAVRQ